MRLSARALVVLVVLALGGYLVVVLARGDGRDDGEKVTSARRPLADPAVAAELVPFSTQKLSWTACGGARCTDVEVPVDYDDAAGATIALRLRIWSSRPDDEKPLLFINPGGPGGSGVDYVSSFVSSAPRSLTDTFDIAGVDPRGVIRSAPLTCVSDAALDRIVNLDPDPDTPHEIAEAVAGSRELGEGCKAAGPLAAHVSTVEVAKDFDILRSVLGEKTFAYYGASYGTAIGARYAELFPSKVGPMVLDAAVDLTASDEELSRGQAVGFDRALNAYLAWCVADDGCPVGDDAAAGAAAVKAFLDDLETTPLATRRDGRELTKSMAFYGIAATLYSRETWSLLTPALTAAFDGDGTRLLALADLYFQRTDKGYSTNAMQVINAVNCLDTPSDLTVDDIVDEAPEYEKASPVFGSIFAWSPLTCAVWPLKPSETPPVARGEGAGPIVVVGTTRDPATPYEWSRKLATQLDSGVLLTRQGDGHGGYLQNDPCIDDAVTAFLTKGEAPAHDTTCPVPKS